MNQRSYAVDHSRREARACHLNIDDLPAEKDTTAPLRMQRLVHVDLHILDFVKERLAPASWNAIAKLQGAP